MPNTEVGKAVLQPQLLQPDGQRWVSMMLRGQNHRVDMDVRNLIFMQEQRLPMQKSEPGKQFGIQLKYSFAENSP